MPYRQIPVGGMTLVVRAAAHPEGLAAAVRRQVLELDNQLPVSNVMTMEGVIARSVWQSRFYTILFGVFATVALVLASVGIYGVMSYAITQRTHEIGIRMALGARRLDILKLTVRQGMTLALAGVAVGLCAAYGLTRLMANLLFGVSATDPETYGFIALLLVSVALLACYIPARRATKVDPLVALRYE